MEGLEQAQAALYLLLTWAEEFQKRNKLPDTETLTIQDLQDIIRDAMNNRWT